jgi:hypothetical protein
MCTRESLFIALNYRAKVKTALFGLDADAASHVAPQTQSESDDPKDSLIT